MRRRWRLASVAGLALALGCGHRRTPSADAGVAGAAGDGSVSTTSPVPVDILFVVDGSPGGGPAQANIAAHAEAFFDALKGADYRVAVVSDDQVNAIERTGDWSGTYGPTAPCAFLTEIDVSRCSPAMISKGCFRGPDPARRIVTSTSSAQFRENVHLGTCGSGIKTGLKAMMSALEQTAPGGCNAGFLRPGATLLVIIVSHQNDTDDTPISSYVEAISRFKPYDKVRIATIVAAENGESTQCSIGQGADCGKMVCPWSPGSGAACNVETPCPMGQSCMPGATGALTCQNPEPPGPCVECGTCTSPDCCSAVPWNSPYLGSPGRYIDFARAMEAKIVTADHSLLASQCKSSVLAACLVESLCQADLTDSLVRIAHALALGH